MLVDSADVETNRVTTRTSIYQRLEISHAPLRARRWLSGFAMEDVGDERAAIPHAFDLHWGGVKIDKPSVEELSDSFRQPDCLYSKTLGFASLPRSRFAFIVCNRNSVCG